MIGRNFNQLPVDAIAVPMIKNDWPLELRYNTSAANVMTMTRMSDTEVIFQARDEREHNPASIGAILSNDREKIYWINDTRPLP